MMKDNEEENDEIMDDVIRFKIASQDFYSEKPLTDEELKAKQENTIIEIALKYRQYLKEEGYVGLAKMPLDFFVDFWKTHLVCKVTKNY